MASPVLISIAESLNYGDLPETWRIPEIERFSSQKTLYDYQCSALKNAARALYRYKGNKHWPSVEPPQAVEARKQNYVNLYLQSEQSSLDEFAVKKYESPTAKRNDQPNQVFKILSDYVAPQDDSIPYYNLINRMCFWMATGSGKTLVMVKLIEYLHHLQQHDEIPIHNILILAPRMCRGNEYRIVFVDPKSAKYTSAYHKIDGYRKLFEENDSPRRFNHKNKGLQVQVELFMFNDPSAAAEKYRGYWINNPERIFQPAAQTAAKR